MSQFPQLTEPLGSHHNRAAFKCRENALQHYLRKWALDDVKNRVANVFVWPAPSDGTLIGYYTLSAASFDVSDLPATEREGISHNLVSAALIGKFAIDKRFERQGYGTRLLADAVLRAFTSDVAVRTIMLDAKNEGVRSFYELFGFQCFPNTELQMYLPMSVVTAFLETRSSS